MENRELTFALSDSWKFQTIVDVIISSLYERILTNPIRTKFTRPIQSVVGLGEKTLRNKPFEICLVSFTILVLRVIKGLLKKAQTIS
jgi:hypothetical protein